MCPDSSARPVDYWTDSRRPLASLIFLLPLLALYELAAARLGGAHIAAVRNGADLWMRSWLLQAGLDRPWALPLLIIAILLGWHAIGRFPWKLSPETIVGMGAESLLGAILLLVIGQLFSLSLHRFGVMSPDIVEVSVSPATAKAVGFVGAGIYEEVLFRLLLLPGVYLLLRVLLLPKTTAAVTAIVSTSLIFALAHYLPPESGRCVLHPQSFAVAAESVLGTSELWFSFGFRLLAGLIFAALFVARGFGITVGCHVTYDLLVGVMTSVHD